MSGQGEAMHTNVPVAGLTADQQAQVAKYVTSVTDQLLKTIEARLQQTAAAAPAPTTTTKKKASLPTPEKYDHMKPSTYKAWEYSIRAKLSLDWELIGGAKEQCLYVYDRLTGSAAQRMLGWMKTYHDTTEQTTENMFLEMQSAFMDHHAVHKALQQLITSKQGNLSVNAFVNATNIRLQETDLYYKTDVASEMIKKNYLKGGLRVSIMEKTIGMVESASYEGYCNQVKSIEDQMNQLKHRDLSRSNYQSPAKTEGDDDEMDWEAAPANTKKFSNSKGKESGGRGGVGQGGSRRQKEFWCEEVEKKRRFDAGECLRCGADNHFVRDCKVDYEKIKKRNNKNRVSTTTTENATRPATAATKPARTSHKKTKMVEVTDDEGSDDDSSYNQGKA